MAVTRNVHKIEAPIRDANAWGTFSWDGQHMVRKEAPKLAVKLNELLASNERIVGTHYVDGSWVIITETFGLGPKGDTT